MRKVTHIPIRNRSNTKRMRMNAMDNDANNRAFKALEADIRDYLETCPASETSPLAYITLRKAGRVDLISRIMDAGGYITVSEKLGVPVDESQFIPPPPTFSAAKLLDADDDYNASLAIGRDLEARLGSIEEVIKNTTDSGEPRRAESKASLFDDVPSGEELRRRNEAILPMVTDRPIPIGESFTLTPAVRIGILTLAGLSAIGFGKASQGNIADELVSTCRSLSQGLLIAHVFLGIYAGAVLAPQKRRNPSLWFAKVILGGPLGIRYLRGLDALPD